MCFYCGDALEQMRLLSESSVDLIVTDPPYYRVKNLAWDRVWKTRDEFVTWIGELCEQWQRVLRPNGSLYVFMGSAMMARIEVEMGSWFDVLSRVVWVKGDQTGNGRWSLADKEELRAWFPQAEYILFAEQSDADGYAMGEAGYNQKCDELRGFVFEPLRAYLANEWRHAGLTAKDANEVCSNQMASHYFTRSQWALPTAANYAKLQQRASVQGGDYLHREYEDLRREYEELRREYEELRRPFNLTPDIPYTDVWTTFPTVSSYPGKHPCEKPVAMLRHIIQASSRPGAIVLDCFCGSAASGEAAIGLGRNYIGIDADENWVKRGQARCESILSAGNLFHPTGMK